MSVTNINLGELLTQSRTETTKKSEAEEQKVYDENYDPAAYAAQIATEDAAWRAAITTMSTNIANVLVSAFGKDEKPKTDDIEGPVGSVKDLDKTNIQELKNDLRAQLATYNSVSDAENALKAFQDNSKVLQDSLTSEEQKLSDANKKYDEIKTKVKPDLIEKYEAQDKEYNLNNQIVQEQEQVITDKTNRKEQIDRDLTSKQETINTNNKQISKLETSITDLTGSISSKKRRIKKGKKEQ